MYRIVAGLTAGSLVVGRLRSIATCSPSSPELASFQSHTICTVAR